MSINEFKFKGQDAQLAPNGQPTKLPGDLYQKVRSREFKRWFGDWENDPENASKVLDENGEPRVVYHGTPMYGFTEFKNTYDQARATENETNSMGVWFSSDEKTAEAFSQMWETGKQGVYAVFLNMRNPKVYSPREFKKQEVDRLQELVDKLHAEKRSIVRTTWNSDDSRRYTEIEDEIDRIKNEMRDMRHNDSYDMFMKDRDRYADYGKEGRVWLDKYINTNKEEANKELVHELQEAGHDGILIEKTQYDSGESETIDQYVLFDTRGIKSVKSVRFDANSPNIYEGRSIYKQIQHLTEMDTFNVKKRKIKNWQQFSAQANKADKEDKKKHPIENDAYSGEKKGKKGLEVLDDRKEEKGKHETVRKSMSGDKKGKAGLDTMDGDQKKK